MRERERKVKRMRERRMFGGVSVKSSLGSDREVLGLRERFQRTSTTGISDES